MSMLLVLSALLGAAPQDVQTLEKLSLQVAPTKPFFLELEPVTLRIRVENPTFAPILVPSNFHAGPSLQVQIAGKDGTFETYHPAWMPFKEPPPAAPPGEGPVVRPQFRAQWTETVYYKTRTPGKAPRRAFDGPGTYVLRVRIYLEDAEVVSNKVEVLIKKPADGVNEAAAEFLKAKDVDRFLGRDGRFYPGTEEGLQNLDAFLRSFPGCVYEPYALFGLGVHRFDLATPALHPQKDYSTPGLRRAAETLTRVAAVKDHPYAADAALLAARAYYHMGDVENARKLLAPVQYGQAFNHQESAEALLRALEKKK